MKEESWLRFQKNKFNRVEESGLCYRCNRHRKICVCVCVYKLNQKVSVSFTCTFYHFLTSFFHSLPSFIPSFASCWSHHHHHHRRRHRDWVKEILFFRKKMLTFDDSNLETGIEKKKLFQSSWESYKTASGWFFIHFGRIISITKRFECLDIIFRQSYRNLRNRMKKNISR
jgi:hypothetical protein